MKCFYCDSNIPEGENNCPVCGLESKGFLEDLFDKKPKKSAPAPSNEPAKTTKYTAAPTPKAAPEAKEKKPGETLGLVAMILAIASLVLGGCCFGPVGPILSVFVTVATLIMSIVALRKTKQAGGKNTCAIIGIIVSIASFVLIAILFVGMTIPMILGFLSEVSLY